MKKTTCRKAEKWLMCWEDDGLTSEESAALSAHLAECPSCRAKKEESQRVKALLERNRPALSEAFSQQVMKALFREQDARRSETRMPTAPWYSRPAFRYVAVAVCAVLIAAIPVGSLLLHPMLQEQNAPSDPSNDGGPNNGGWVSSWDQSDKPSQDAEEALSYLTGQGMTLGSPWAQLLDADDKLETEMDAPPEMEEPGEAAPEETRPEAEIPEEEQPEYGGGFSDVTVEADMDCAPPAQDGGNLEGEAPPNIGTDSPEDRFAVQTGTTVTLSLTVLSDGTARWEGKLESGADVLLLHHPDGGYTLSVNGDTVSHGQLLGFKAGHLLLKDEYIGGIALPFALQDHHLTVEVPNNE